MFSVDLRSSSMVSTSSSSVGIPAKKSSGTSVDSSSMVALASMMMQTMEAERAASEARMGADTALKDSLALALRRIEELTETVNKQGAEIVALKQSRALETAAQGATIAELQRKVEKLDKLVKIVNELKEIQETVLPLLRYVWFERRKLARFENGNPSGNLLDPYNQIIAPAGFLGGRYDILSKLTEYLAINTPEEWKVGYVKPPVRAVY